MLVHEYLDQVIAARPYKYSTKQTLVKDIKRMGIWDLDISQINSGLIRDKFNPSLCLQLVEFGLGSDPNTKIYKEEENPPRHSKGLGTRE